MALEETWTCSISAKGDKMIACIMSLFVAVFKMDNTKSEDFKIKESFTQYKHEVAKKPLHIYFKYVKKLTSKD